ncbi:MAG: DUF502 domain-containing protein [Parachlamydiaceae bacterium]|nr:DUF502 domain-containing protein [Parachlamydiaceae bacterium]
MKRNFFAGLFILLPFALTLFIVSFIINILTAPFQDIVSTILNYYDILDKPFLFFSGDQMAQISSKIFVLMALFGIVMLVGFLGRLLLLTSIIRVSEVLIHRIPMVSPIYKATKEIIKTFFNSQANTFSKVVLVPFPNPNAYCIGLISQDKPIGNYDTITVFIPTAPNLTIGYMLAFKPADLIFVDMKVDDAVKCIVSCGIMFPEYKILLEEK